MAYDNSQNETPLPTGKNGNETRKASKFLPRYFRTVANEKFISSTLDQLISSGTVEKVNGYIGRRNAKAFNSTDSYINDISNLRQDYQLEPATVNVTTVEPFEAQLVGLTLDIVGGLSMGFQAVPS